MRASVSVQPAKHTMVTEILKNDVYMPDSGVWCRLYNRLMALSTSDLYNLKLIVDLKIQAAVEAATQR